MFGVVPSLGAGPAAPGFWCCLGRGVAGGLPGVPTLWSLRVEVVLVHVDGGLHEGGDVALLVGCRWLVGEVLYGDAGLGGDQERDSLRRGGLWMQLPEVGC